jgi:hypothetical protein
MSPVDRETQPKLGPFAGVFTHQCGAGAIQSAQRTGHRLKEMIFHYPRVRRVDIPGDERKPHPRNRPHQRDHPGNDRGDPSARACSRRLRLSDSGRSDQESGGRLQPLAPDADDSIAAAVLVGLVTHCRQHSANDEKVALTNPKGSGFPGAGSRVSSRERLEES